MIHRLFVVTLFLALFLYLPAGSAQAATAATYYVDCIAGSDVNSGLSASQAWKTLNRTGGAAFAPGARLLLKRGCAWNGMLYVPWQGTATQPITISAYGRGSLPIIQNASHSVYVTGSYVTIEMLAARADVATRDSGCGNQPVGNYNGFTFGPGAAFNTLRYSRATGLTFGVEIQAGAHHNTVTNNVLTGNTMMRTLDRDNPNNDAGAVGIFVSGDDNEVANNKIGGQDACSYDYGRDGAAVEIFGGQRNRIHHNQGVDNNAFTELGDARSADNFFAYNQVTSNTAGAAFLVTRGGGDSWGPVARTNASNNTVHLSDAESHAVVCVGGCSGDILALTNNIIWAEGSVGYADQPFQESYNIYWRADGQPLFKFNGMALSSTSRVIDPQVVEIASENFQLKAESPAIDAGTDALYPRDLASIPVPQAAGVDLGAWERSTTLQESPASTSSISAAPVVWLPLVTR